MVVIIVLKNPIAVQQNHCIRSNAAINNQSRNESQLNLFLFPKYERFITIGNRINPCHDNVLR